MSRYSNYNYLKIEVVEDGVGLITFNRPEKSNAYDLVDHVEMVKIWDEIDHDPDIRVAVVTGAGNDFCHAGADLDSLLTTWLNMSKSDFFAQTMRGMREGEALAYNLINCEKPIISAVNGAASGGGLVIAILADISVVSETAPLREVHIPGGVTAGDNVVLWPLLCGLAKAKLYALTGGTLDGKEAERIGLVSRAVSSDQVLPVALEYARQLANGPQHAIRFTKKGFNQWLRLGGITAFDYTHVLELLTFFDVDIEAAMSAGLKREAPKFPSVKTAGPRHI